MSTNNILIKYILYNKDRYIIQYMWCFRGTSWYNSTFCYLAGTVKTCGLIDICFPAEQQSELAYSDDVTFTQITTIASTEFIESEDKLGESSGILRRGPFVKCNYTHYISKQNQHVSYKMLIHIAYTIQDNTFGC